MCNQGNTVKLYWHSKATIWILSHLHKLLQEDNTVWPSVQMSLQAKNHNFWRSLNPLHYFKYKVSHTNIYFIKYMYIYIVCILFFFFFYIWARPAEEQPCHPSPCPTTDCAISTGKCYYVGKRKTGIVINREDEVKITDTNPVPHIQANLAFQQTLERRTLLWSCLSLRTGRAGGWNAAGFCRTPDELEKSRQLQLSRGVLRSEAETQRAFLLVLLF